MAPALVLNVTLTRRFRYLDDRASEINHFIKRIVKTPSTSTITPQLSPTIHLSTLDLFLTNLDFEGIGFRARGSEGVSNVSLPEMTQ